MGSSMQSCEGRAEPQKQLQLAACVSERKGLWFRICISFLTVAWTCCRAVRDARSHGDVDKWREDDRKQEAVRESIKSALHEIFDKHNEVPFLAMYRKQVDYSTAVLLPAHASPLTTAAQLKKCSTFGIITGAALSPE